MSLAEKYQGNKDTKEFRKKVDNWQLTAEDFAGMYLFEFGSNALTVFEKDCGGEMDMKFFNQIKDLMIADSRIAH